MISKYLLIFCITICLYACWPAAASGQESPPAEAPRPIGRMVDLGGYKLHVNCVGKGKPTVVLSIGGGGFSTDWALVQSRVATFTRICSYDRSGAAWSDLGPKPRTMDQEAFDLHRLLAAAGEHGPYIIVGQSIGGMVARIFTEKYPKDVVGVVLVDAFSEDAQLFMNGAMRRVRLLAKDRPIPDPRSNTVAADRMTPAELQEKEVMVKKYVGDPKIQPPYDSLPEYAQRIRLWALRQPKNYAEDDDYMAEISAREYARDQAQEHPLNSTPLIVLTRDKSTNDYPPPLAASLGKEHEEQQALMVRLSSHGTQIIVPGSGHEIELYAPAKVAAAIQEIAVYRGK